MDGGGGGCVPAEDRQSWEGLQPVLCGKRYLGILGSRLGEGSGQSIGELPGSRIPRTSLRIVCGGGTWLHHRLHLQIQSSPLGQFLNRSNKTAVLVLGGWADLGQCPRLSKNVWSHFYPFVGLLNQPFSGRLFRASSGGHSPLKVQGHSFPQRAERCPRGLHFQQTVVSGPNPSYSSGGGCEGHQHCRLFPLVRLPGEAGLAGAPSQEGGRALRFPASSPGARPSYPSSCVIRWRQVVSQPP
jgi:hypothetical protein